MSLTNILFEIDAEISRLEQAKQLLSGTTIKRGPGRPPKDAVTVPKKKRSPMSAAGRAKIAAAQKARWAKARNVK